MGIKHEYTIWTWDATGGLCRFYIYHNSVKWAMASYELRIDGFLPLTESSKEMIQMLAPDLSISDLEKAIKDWQQKSIGGEEPSLYGWNKLKGWS